MGFVFSWFSQVAAVTWLNLRNLKERLASSAATVVGVAGVVLVVVAVLSVGLGLSSTLSSTGDPASVMVMRSGSDTEMTSVLMLDETRIIADAPGVLRGESGAAASAELFVIVDVPKRATGTDANVPLRGVEPAAFEVRESFEIVAGRRFEAGRNEVIVGEGALGEFAGLDVGTELRWGDSDWRVVGVFSTGGTAEDTELWCDAKVLQPAYRRGSSFQSVHLRLASPERFAELEEALTGDPRLNVKVLLKSDYWSGQSTAMIGLIRTLGIVIGGLMGFGAVFGALNTMYAAVSARTREIATLRALGFNASPVVISVLIESLVLALVGGLLGAGHHLAAARRRPLGVRPRGEGPGQGQGGMGLDRVGDAVDAVVDLGEVDLDLVDGLLGLGDGEGRMVEARHGIFAPVSGRLGQEFAALARAVLVLG